MHQKITAIHGVSEFHQWQHLQNSGSGLMPPCYCLSYFDFPSKNTDEYHPCPVADCILGGVQYKKHTYRAVGNRMIGRLDISAKLGFP